MESWVGLALCSIVPFKGEKDFQVRCVPSYQLLPFLDWLQQSKGFDFDDSIKRLPSRELEKHAIEYLESSGRSRNSGLVAFLTMFQFASPHLRSSKDGDANVAEQFRRFAESPWMCAKPSFFYRHIGMITERDLRRFVNGLNGYRLSTLHPLLQGFVEFLEDSDIRDLDLNTLEVFWHRRYGRSLVEKIVLEFEEYNRFVQVLSPWLIEGYLLQQKEGGWRFGDENMSFKQFKTYNEYTNPINFKSSTEDQPRQLAESVTRALHGQSRDAFRKALRWGFDGLVVGMAARIVPDDFRSEWLEFMDWLKGRMRKDLQSPMTIQADEIPILAIQFSRERGYSNEAVFARKAKSWMTRNGSTDILDSIKRLIGFGIEKGPTLGQGDGTTNPVKRFMSVGFHGIFLFEETGDFAGFLRAQQRDLDAMTSDHLDVYYTQSDLKQNVSGYHTQSKLRFLKDLYADSIPCFILWERSLEEHQVIRLTQLTHDEIKEVVKSVVSGIQSGGDLTSIVRLGVERAVSYRTCKYMQGNVQQFFGVNTVDNREINNNGIIGDGNTATGNNFQQIVGDSTPLEKLSGADVGALKNLIQGLLSAHANELNGEWLIAAGHIQAVIKNGADSVPDETALKSLRDWLSTLSQPALLAFSTFASAVTLANDNVVFKAIKEFLRP